MTGSRRNLPISLAFSCSQDAVSKSQSGVMKRVSGETSADQLQRDFRIFSERGFLAAIGTTILFGAIVAGVMLYGAW